MCKLLSGYITVIGLSHLSSLLCFLLILPQGKDFEQALTLDESKREENQHNTSNQSLKKWNLLDL